MTLRERRRIQQRQLGKSACAKHPDQRLAMRHREPWCVECDTKPEAVVRVLSETKKYLQGDRTQNAAIVSKLNDKYGEGSMSEEQSAALAVIRSSPPDIMPSYDEAVQLTKQFTGWNTTKEGKEIKPSMATAVAIHGLLKMGVLPVHINILGGNSVYVTIDGFIAHAQAVIEQRGEKWGRIVYTTKLSDGEYERLNLAKDAGHLVIKATYQREITTDRRKEYPDGAVETWQEPVWFDVQSALGSADPKILYKEQPVENKHPARMAEVRATRRMLRLMAGIKYPQAVGVLSDVGIIEEAVLPENDQPMNVLEAGDIEAPVDLTDAENQAVTEAEEAAHKRQAEEAAAEKQEYPSAPVDARHPRHRYKISPELASLTVEKIKALKVESIDAFRFNDTTAQAGVMAMLRAGYTADEVANAVAEVCKPANEDVDTTVDVQTSMMDEPQAKPPVKTVEGGEDVEELPW